MRRQDEGLKTALWSLVLAAGVFALWMQGASAHRENLVLQNRIHDLDGEIRLQEKRLQELQQLRDGLKEDPYAVERALRDTQTAGEERLLPPVAER